MAGVITASMVTVQISSNVASFTSEKRYGKDITIAALKVIDKNPGVQAGEFEDVSKVEKFEISAEDYAKRTDSVQAFKMRNKMGRFRETTPGEEERSKEKARQEQEAAQALSVGSRCEVRMAGVLARRGQVMFVGMTEFKPGYWVGIKYDEPLGKNDGSVAGKRYFQCLPKYGGFVKPKDVVVGDFPEDDLGIGDDDEM